MLYRDIIFLSITTIFKKFYFEKLFGAGFSNIIFYVWESFKKFYSEKLYIALEIRLA